MRTSAATRDESSPARRRGAMDGMTGRKRRSRTPLYDRIGGWTYWRLGLSALLVILLVWWLVDRLALINPYFLPSPGQVLRDGLELCRSGELVADLRASVTRITVGFLISTAFALPVGTAMGSVPRVEALIEPTVDFIRYMPAVAFVPLTVVWFGVGESQKYAIIFIGTFFQQVLMIMDSVKRVPHEYINLGQTLGLGAISLLTRIVIPASAPAIWDTLRVTLGWAWTWLIVAELVAAQTGLGHRILTAQRYFQTDRIFFVIVVIGALGLIMDQVMKILGWFLFRWSADSRP